MAAKERGNVLRKKRRRARGVVNLGPATGLVTLPIVAKSYGKNQVIV